MDFTKFEEVQVNIKVSTSVLGGRTGFELERLFIVYRAQCRANSQMKLRQILPYLKAPNIIAGHFSRRGIAKRGKSIA